jgi:hypothetical protein
MGENGVGLNLVNYFRGWNAFPVTLYCIMSFDVKADLSWIE